MKPTTLFAALSSLVIGGGCGQTSQSTRTPAPSAETYRQQAAQETAASEKELAAANAAPAAPNLTASAGNNPQGYYYDLNVYSTRDQHLARAHSLSEHARQHAELAAKLDGFEGAECGEFPPATRAACPLLGPVTQLTDLTDGVRVQFAPGTRTDAVLAHMRCHLAFAQTRGFEPSAAACPLYIPGIEIRAGEGGTIEIVSPQPKVAREIQSRSRQEAVLVRAGGN